jgi:hypothetical protein
VRRLKWTSTDHGGRYFVKVALVGGGKAAAILPDYFASLENVTVVGLSDIKEDASGFIRALLMRLSWIECMKCWAAFVKPWK